MNRREFLMAAGALAALPDLSASGANEDDEAHSHPEPPYLKLKQFIEPGNDEFSGETEAFALKAKLQAALASK